LIWDGGSVLGLLGIRTSRGSGAKWCWGRASNATPVPASYKNSKDAECDAARVLLSRGITGKITMEDAKTGKPRNIVNIEKAAKVTVSETRKHGPRFVTWTPNPWASGVE